MKEEKFVVTFEHGRKDRLDYNTYKKEYVIQYFPEELKQAESLIGVIKGMTELYCRELSPKNDFYRIIKIVYHTTVNGIPVELKVPHK